MDDDVTSISDGRPKEEKSLERPICFDASKQKIDISPMTESSPKVTTEIVTTEITKVKTPTDEDQKEEEQEQEVGFLERQDTTVIHKVPFNLVSWENFKKNVNGRQNMIDFWVTISSKMFMS